MKTTLEIPDPIFRRAKALAAKRGIPLRQLVTEAVDDKLRSAESGQEKPWMENFGQLRHLRKDLHRINRIVEEEFETIDPELWK